MKNADIEWVENRKKEIERYGSMEEAIKATGVTYQGYAKTKFTINMPDGSSYTERQDIGDGFGGVIDFLSKYPQYNDILPVLKEQIAIERNTPIQDVSDIANNTQSVELENADLIGKEFTLDDRRFRVEKISMFGDVSLRDLEFERVNGFPISRVEKVELVRYALEIEAEMKKHQQSIKLSMTFRLVMLFVLKIKNGL